MRVCIALVLVVLALPWLLVGFGTAVLLTLSPQQALGARVLTGSAAFCLLLGIAFAITGLLGRREQGVLRTRYVWSGVLLLLPCACMTPLALLI
jgi:hypothetical protein